MAVTFDALPVFNTAFTQLQVTSSDTSSARPGSARKITLRPPPPRPPFLCSFLLPIFLPCIDSLTPSIAFFHAQPLNPKHPLLSCPLSCSRSRSSSRLQLSPGPRSLPSLSSSRSFPSPSKPSTRLARPSSSFMGRGRRYTRDSSSISNEERSG